MPLTSEDRYHENVAQAQWRVNFRRSLLDAHLGLDRTASEWRKREQELLESLDEATKELDQIKSEAPPSK